MQVSLEDRTEEEEEEEEDEEEEEEGGVDAASCWLVAVEICFHVTHLSIGVIGTPAAHENTCAKSEWGRGGGILIYGRRKYEISRHNAHTCPLFATYTCKHAHSKHTHILTQHSAIHHTAAPSTTLQHAATHCNTLQHTATHCNTLQRTATHCSQHWHSAASGTAKARKTLQYAAPQCTTLQLAAPHCTTLQHRVHPQRHTRILRNDGFHAEDRRCVLTTRNEMLEHLVVLLITPILPEGYKHKLLRFYSSFLTLYVQIFITTCMYL